MLTPQWIRDIQTPRPSVIREGGTGGYHLAPAEQKPLYTQGISRRSRSPINTCPFVVMVCAPCACGCQAELFKGAGAPKIHSSATTLSTSRISALSSDQRSVRLLLRIHEIASWVVCTYLSIYGTVSHIEHPGHQPCVEKLVPEDLSTRRNGRAPKIHGPRPMSFPGTPWTLLVYLVRLKLGTWAST